jgi:steroid 5-alpha reductase family enzyme
MDGPAPRRIAGRRGGGYTPCFEDPYSPGATRVHGMTTALAGLLASLALMLIAWAVSLVRRDAGLADVFWGPAIAAGGVAYAAIGEPSARAALALGLALVWALRLAAHLLRRNHGQPEDRRYRAIRARHEPGFACKSLYLVFGLQAVLAWVVGLPLYGVVIAGGALGVLDVAGAALAVFGLGYEALADWQLARFRRAADAAHGVMERGLWRYSRHPNYFGEVCVWWGLWLIALAGGAWWTAIGPALLTVLLLRVSGIALTEKDIADRRPGYRDYIRRTSAFVPWRPAA